MEEAVAEERPAQEPAAPATDAAHDPVGTDEHEEPASDLHFENPLLEVQSLSLWYGDSQALQAIKLAIPEKKITAFIGPSGCGKSTLLRCFNRLNDLIDIVRIEGDILFEGRSIHDAERGLSRRVCSGTLLVP